MCPVVKLKNKAYLSKDEKKKKGGKEGRGGGREGGREAGRLTENTDRGRDISATFFLKIILWILLQIP